MDNNDDEKNEKVIHWYVYVVEGIIVTLFAIKFIWFCGNVYINGADFITKISIIPFAICGLGVLLKGVTDLAYGFNIKKIGNDVYDLDEVKPDFHKKLNKICSKIFVIGFLLFWFGFLIVFDYLAMQDGEKGIVAFSIIFWVVGIYFAIKNLK